MKGMAIVRTLVPVFCVLVLASCGKTTDEKIPGDIRNFDPVAQVPDLIGEGGSLVSLSARYVRPDGTIDIKAKYVRKGETVVKFQVVRYDPDPVPAETKPVKEKKSDAPLSTEPPPQPTSYPMVSPPYEHATVIIARPDSGVTRTTGSGYPTGGRQEWWRRLGMSSYTKRYTQSLEGAVPLPVLSFSEIWEKAINLGTPENAVAQIDYDVDGYRFSIAYTDIKLDFDIDGRYRDPELLAAAEAGEIDSVTKMLANNLSPESQDDDTGRTALMIAAENGHEDIVNLLLEYGCRVDMRDAEGRTALMDAAQKGHAAIVKRFIDAGADPNVRTTNNMTPRVAAMSWGTPEASALFESLGAR